MANQPKHGLRQTPGSFEIKGIVNCVKNKNFYTEKDIAGSSTKMRSVNLGIEYGPKMTLYPIVQGFTRSDVYFSKRDGNGKTETKKIPWSQRMEFAAQNTDWRIIGTNIGITKDEEGNNIKKYLTEYDAAAYIKENLTDGVSVFTRGTIDYRSYTAQNGDVKRAIDYNASQLSLCAEINFEDENYEPHNTFSQELVYTEIAKEEDADGKPTGRFILSGYVVSYNSIEPVSFIVRDSALANKIRKNMKPYNSIVCNGWIEVVHSIDSVQEVDDWGQPIPKEFQRASAPSVREMVVGYVKPETLDTDSYSENAIQEGIKKLKEKAEVKKNFGESDTAVSAQTENNGWDDADNGEEEDW